MNLVALDPTARRRIAEHAVTKHPEEACGILIGRPDGDRVRVVRALPCPNLAPPADRGRRFEIEPLAVLNVQRELRSTAHEIVGFYHSHPDGSTRPSATDLDYVRLWPETVWLIAGVTAPGAAGALRAWWLDAAGDGAVRELAIVGDAPAGAPACPD